MVKMEYDNLNNYLNKLCLVLDRKNPFLLENLFGLIKLNDNFYSKFKNYESKEEYFENNLTFEEVIDISKEIIEFINPEYLKQFKDYENTGKIDFNYEAKKNDTSEFRSKEYLRYTRSDQKYIMTIERTPRILINRKFNYYDVVALIHEFFHSLNREGKENINNIYLTEYISIYFETLATEYLVKEKDVNPNEIQMYHRINDSVNCAKDEFIFRTPLLAFIKFGNIDESTYKFVGKYFLYKKEEDVNNILKEIFDKECKHLLSVFEKNKNKFKTEEEFFEDFAGFILNGYKYVIGTLLAFYSKEKLSMEKMIYLNDNINNYDFNMLNPIEALAKIGIDLSNPDFFEVATESLEKYIEELEEIKDKMGNKNYK